MKEIFILALASGSLFMASVILVFIGIVRKNKNAVIFSVLTFFLFIVCAGYTGVRFFVTSCKTVSELVSPRTGMEIYTDLFGAPAERCISIFHFQDQVIPKIDFATALEFETCPAELHRLLSKHPFSMEKFSTRNWSGDVPMGIALEWFRPKSLGDTVLVFEYASDDRRNIQTFWVSADSTKVFCRYIYD